MERVHKLSGLSSAYDSSTFMKINIQCVSMCVCTCAGMCTHVCVLTYPCENTVGVFWYTFASTSMTWHSPHGPQHKNRFLSWKKKFFLLMFTFLKAERDRAWASPERGRERGWQRIRSSLRALSCQHRAQHGAQTHEQWDHGLSWSQMLNQLSHPGAPKIDSLTQIRAL